MFYRHKIGVRTEKRTGLEVVGIVWLVDEFAGGRDSDRKMRRLLFVK